MQAGFKASVQFVWTISLVICLLYELFSAQLMGLFMDTPSAAALQAGVGFLRIAAPFYFAASFKIMCDAFLCGAKLMRYVVFSIFLDLSLRAGTAVLCSSVFHTAFSVWFARPIGWSIAAAVTYFLYAKAVTAEFRDITFSKKD